MNTASGSTNKHASPLPEGTRSRRGASAALALLVVVLSLAALWGARRTVLGMIGTALVTEDPLRPADVAVVSIAGVRAGALEAARLYRAGLAGRVIVSRWQDEPLDATLRTLGVPHLVPHELARAILERAGVPPHAVRVLDEPVDGTESEVAAVSRVVWREQPGSVLFLTARSHSARARWLLDRTLPGRVPVAVRSAPGDGFQPAAWWRSREDARELVMEYLRWAHAVLREGGLLFGWRSAA